MFQFLFILQMREYGKKLLLRGTWLYVVNSKLVSMGPADIIPSYA
jgi:hypothetical protein